MAQYMNSGLVQSNLIIGTAITTQPNNNAKSVFHNSSTSANFVVPAGKKWLVTSIWAYATGSSGAWVQARVGATPYEMLRTTTQYVGNHFSGNPLIVLSAADYMKLDADAGACGFTYYEVNA